jgi:hypothetical protein
MLFFSNQVKHINDQIMNEISTTKFQLFNENEYLVV